MLTDTRSSINPLEKRALVFGIIGGVFAALVLYSAYVIYAGDEYETVAPSATVSD